MKYYTEPSREIPVAAETEVLVVGGGRKCGTYTPWNTMQP